MGLGRRSVSLSPLLKVHGTGSLGRGQRDALGRRDLPEPPSSLPPSELPLPIGRLGNEGGRRFCCLRKTPSPPNGKDPQLDLRNSPRGPSPNLSLALALSPRFRALGAGPLLEGALRGGRNATPPRWPLGGQDPGERRALPLGSPFFPAPSEGGSPGGAGAAGLERLDGAPSLRVAPSPHPPAPAGAAPTHPAMRRHRLRREGGAAAARGGRGGRRGGRGAGGGTARETPRGVGPEPFPWGGSLFLPFPSNPGAGGSGALGSAPAPAREREGDALTSPAPSLGSARRGRRTEVSNLLSISTQVARMGSGAGYQCPETSFRARDNPGLSTLKPTWARSRTSLRGQNPGRFDRRPPSHHASTRELTELGALPRGGSSHFSRPGGLVGADTPPTHLGLREPRPHLLPTARDLTPAPTPLRMNLTSQHGSKLLLPYPPSVPGLCLCKMVLCENWGAFPV